MDKEKQKEILSKRGLVIGIVGSIPGVGTSTFARLLGEEWGAKVFEERFEDNPYLKHFYKDPKNYAALSQKWFLDQAFETIYSQESKVTPGTTIIRERDPHGHKIFKDAQVKMGWISEQDSQNYDNYFSNMMNNVREADIYLLFRNERPEEGLSGILARGREMEKTITEDYLRALDEEFSEWAIQKNEENAMVFHTGTRTIDFQSDNPQQEGSVSKRVASINNAVGHFSRHIVQTAKEQKEEIIVPKNIRERMWLPNE